MCVQFRSLLYLTIYILCINFTTHDFPRGKWTEYSQRSLIKRSWKIPFPTILSRHGFLYLSSKFLTRFINQNPNPPRNLPSPPSNLPKKVFDERSKVYLSALVRSISRKQILNGSCLFAKRDRFRESGNNRGRWKNRVIRDRGYGRERNAKGVEIEKSEIKGRDER